MQIPHPDANLAKPEILPGDVPLELIEVKGGSFTMGDNTSEHEDEKPEHPVQVNDFFLGIYPVTNLQFAAFLNDYQSDKVKTGIYNDQQMIYEHRWGLQFENEKWISAKGFEQHPVINVTWHGANEFCAWLNQKTGKNYALPSEAQWEYAARGGNQSLGFPYAGSYKLKEVGWYSKNSNGETKPVGLKLPNELGLHDMSGNVDEWCLDHWHENYEGAPKDGSAWLDPEKANDPEARRVVRGGSWSNNDNFCRVSFRFRYVANYRFFNLGFRVLRY